MLQEQNFENRLTPRLWRGAPPPTIFKICSFRSGFTLVETLVAVAIIALVSYLVVIPFASFRDEKLLDGAAEDILTLLDEARARTLSSDGASPYGVYFESDKMILFKGVTFVAGDSDNKELALHNRLTISEVALVVVPPGAANGSSLVFERLTGAAGSIGTVTISLISDATQKRIITISAAGSVGLK